MALGLSTLGGVANAAPITYQYTIYGDVVSGDEFAPNWWNLTVGDIISASGEFTVDDAFLGPIGGEDGTVVFGAGDSMTIDLLGGQTLTEADAYSGYVALSFVGGTLVGLDYIYTNGGGEDFNSYFDNFDDFDSLVGLWQTNANLTVVPIPAAVWMFGSGLLALAGWSRRRS